MQGWGTPEDWMRTDVANARNAVADLRSGVANLTTPAGKQEFINNIGIIARSMDGVLRGRNDEAAIKDVHTKMIPVIMGTAQDVNRGNVEATNVNENINKIEEHMNDIARKANVGGRRRGKNTRKGKKGKKRTTRRR
jgi:hypothetical protein